MGAKSDWQPVGDMRLLYPYLPKDTSKQCHALKEAIRFLPGRSSAARGPIRLLDLGCGAGDSHGSFLQTGLSVEWLGLDIEDSPEAKGKATSDAAIQVYDGLHIPGKDATFDIVYSRQAFEHVRYPRELIKEVYRVLKGEGVFVGSCSALEPFHSRSLFNYTPYGFGTLLDEAGFCSILLRPGIDGLTLIGRRLLGSTGIAVGSWMFAKESPFNLLLEAATRIIGFDTSRRAAIKLLFCGHFVFSALKCP